MTAPGQDEAQARASRFGLTPGMTVQELGYDEDVDALLREGVEDIIGSELVDEDYEDVVDVVLMWWRDDDGDLAAASLTDWNSFSSAAWTGTAPSCACRACSRSTRRPVRISRHPSAAKRSAQARPKPEVAPVIQIVFCIIHSLEGF